ncbi:efflux RND transporter permease subunit [Sulfurihydrogenibium subterraneum]|uniref:efflux RND transporter permease subunit n=1 Tax=Sulfurihydrogenibium subterraneum TaxID=171121 RepID=UPI00048BDEFC|nr:efflux RND transporter permease subunit [Sulfurihydrogenibium subterraneum]
MINEKFFHYLIKRKIFIILLLFLTSAVGYYLSLNIPKDVFPNVFFPRVEVSIENGYTPTKQMLIEITKPVEESLKSVQYVEKVVSKTSVGSTEINLYFSWNVDPYVALQLVQAKMADIRSNLPPNAKVFVRQATPSAYPIAIYAITSDVLPREKLTEILYYNLKPVMLSINGVYDIDLRAPLWREYHIVIDYNKLVENQIDPNILLQVLREQSQINFIGKFDTADKQFILSLNQKPEDIYKLLDVRIPTKSGNYLNLSDIAMIVESTNPSRATSAFSGSKNAVVFNLLKQPNANSISIVNEFDALIESLNKKLAKDGVKIVKSYDSTIFVDQSIKSVRDAIVLGSLISVIIFFIFLRKVKISIVTLFIIPVVFFTTIIGIKLIGIDFNLFSLGGMAAAIGGLVDHIIIVIENLERHQKMGKPKYKAVIDGSIEILPIMTIATLVSVLIFIPLILVSGIVGVFFKQLAIVMVITYLISQILAIFFVPIMAYLLLPEESKQENDFIEKIKLKYLNFFKKAIKFDYLSIPVIIILFLLTYFLYTKIPSTFLPKWDEGNLVVDFTFTPGTSLEDSYKEALEIGKIISSIPEVENWTLRIGTSLGHLSESSNVGDFLVILKKDRDRSIFQIQDEIREKVETRFKNLQEFDLPQVIEDRLADIMGEEAPISVILYGKDPDKLITYGEKLRDKLREKSILEEVNLKTNYTAPEITIKVKPSSYEIYGLTVDDIYNQLNTIYWGQVFGSIISGEQIINLRLIYLKNTSLYDLEKTLIYSPKSDSFVPLNQIAYLQLKNNVPEITHYNLSPVAVITSRFKGDNMSEAIKVINATISEMNLPSDITPVLSGFYKQQKKSFKEMSIAITLAILIIFISLSLVFADVIISLSILFAVILPLFGIFALLLILGKPLDITALMGILIVLSITINNNILIFDFYKNSTETNEIKRVLEAVSSRFRPITMTMLSNSLAMLPIALSIGSGTQIIQNLAISILGGLSFAIVVNLLIIPLFFLFVKRNFGN